MTVATNVHARRVLIEPVQFSARSHFHRASAGHHQFLFGLVRLALILTSCDLLVAFLHGLASCRNSDDDSSRRGNSFSNVLS